MSLPRLLLTLLAALLAGCGGAPDPAVRDDERRLGAEQHPLLLAEFGGPVRVTPAKAGAHEHGQRRMGS